MRPSYQPRGPRRSPVVALTFIYRRVGLRPAVVSSARTYGLSWVAPSVALPRLNLCLHYSRSFEVCQPLFGNFLSLSFHRSRGSPSRLDRPNYPPFGRIILTLVRHCCPPSLGGGAQPRRLPTFRAIAACSGGHRFPLESSPFDGLIIAHLPAYVNTFPAFFLRKFRPAKKFQPAKNFL